MEKTFVNASLKSINNGVIEIIWDNKTIELENASVKSVMGGTIVVEQEFNFKEGDLVYFTDGTRKYLVIYKEMCNSGWTLKGHYFIDLNCDAPIHPSNGCIQLYNSTTLVAATPEKMLMFDIILKKCNLQWNSKRLCVEEYEFVPELGEKYYFVAGTGNVDHILNVGGFTNSNHIAIRNCFRTEKEAEVAAKKFKEFFKSL